MPCADFDPLELTAQASLNRVVIGDVGCPEIAGMRAEDACSRDALCALAADCGLTRLRPDRLSDGLASAAASTDAHASRGASAALAGFGRRLGALIATLRDPTTADNQADTPARRAFLSYWLTIDSIWLAGGLLAGDSGHTIISGAEAGSAVAAQPCRVELAPHPAVAPLLGAAQCARATDVNEVYEAIAVADLGHTSIRTAIAERSAAALTRLSLVSAYTAPPPRGSPDEVEEAVVDALVGVVRRAAAANARSRSTCLRAHSHSPSSYCAPSCHVIVSVASHVAGGVPVDDGEGVYGCLANSMPSLRRRIAAGSSVDVTLEFVHDGTAAAATAASANSATITAGTWLGVGFKPVHASPLLLNLAPNLGIDSN